MAAPGSKNASRRLLQQRLGGSGHDKSGVRHAAPGTLVTGGSAAPTMRPGRRWRRRGSKLGVRCGNPGRPRRERQSTGGSDPTIGGNAGMWISDNASGCLHAVRM